MLEFPFLLLLGFIVGIGGAVIPGPLLAFVIFDTTRKRRVVGPFVIAGHALWEAFIIFLILFGLGSIILQYRLFIYVVGGAVLVLMGVLMVRGIGDIEIKGSRVNSSMLGGVFYTAFNPTQPPWWASAGLALLLQGYELLGSFGIIIVTAGHWLADLTYYSLISYIICKCERLVIPRQRQLTLILAAFVAALGTYFIINGIVK